MKNQLSLPRLRGLLRTIIVINASFGVFMAWQHLNFLQVDLAGHLWSSVQFGRGLFHQFSDRIFMGYIHGLFYPPLEDFLQFLIRTFTGQSPFEGYRSYQMCLIALYFFSIWRLIGSFRLRTSLLFAGVVILFLVNIEKPELVKLQGMSLIDLLITGLSNQILAAAFLFLMIREILANPYPRIAWITFFLTLSLLSHIVVGLVALLYAGLHAIITREKPLTRAIFWSLGISAFYWVPFVAHKGFLVSSNIFNFSPWVPWFIALLATVTFWSDRKTRAALLTSLALLSTVTVFQIHEWLAQHVPKFHYYRFTIVGFMFLGLGLSLAYESQKSKSRADNRALHRLRSIAVGVLMAVFLVYLATNFRLQRYDSKWKSFDRTIVDFRGVTSLETEGYGRYFVIGSDRTSDTGLDSILSAKYPDFKSTKGLYWESSRSNTVQSSFLATLLGPPVVLDYFYFYGYNCDVQRCLTDQFFRYYNVKGLIVNTSSLSYVSPERRSCFQKLIDGGTNYFNFRKTGEVRITDLPYTTYRLVAKSQAPMPVAYSNEVLELAAPGAAQSLGGNSDQYHTEVLRAAFRDCSSLKESKTRFFVFPKDWEEIQSLMNTQALPEGVKNLSEGLVFEKLSETQFKLHVPSGAKKLYVIKLNPQPSMHIAGEGGPRIFAAYPYILIHGSGEMVLTFGRTPQMYLGYLISIGTMAFFIFRVRRRRSIDLATTRP